MATNTLWKVIYHFESSSNHKAGWDSQQNATVLAADGKEDTIRSVLTSNNVARPGATIAIDHVSNVNVPGGFSNVLS